MTIPLEDTFSDIIGKAQRGLKFTDRALFLRAAIGPYEDTLLALKAGEFHHTALLKLAPALGLHAKALVAVAQGKYSPAPVEVEGLAQFNTQFEDMTVNAYIAWDAVSKTAAAFDTGADAQPMIDFIKAKGLTLKSIFLTHTHADHIAGLDALKAATGCKDVFSNVREAQPDTTTFEAGASWDVGVLKIGSRSTWGHSKGGTTFVISGLAQPVAVVGDALFAGSMGGGGISYTDALETNRKEIMTLPDNTVVCPGHGPLTTIAEEKANNPFFPEFK